MAEPNRFALLIGNKDYTSKVGPLSNPLNDVALVERSLRQLGFSVRILENLDRRAMDAALKEYVADLQKAKGDAIGFFYYSGHGASNSATGTNYLIPVDVANADDDTLWQNSVNLSEIIELLTRQAGNAFHYVVFDACRDELRLSSATKSVGGSDKGFVPVISRGGVLIAYATSPGRSASDTGSGSGPYARALATELLNKRHVNAVTIFGAVARRVKEETAGKQEPWFSASPMPEYADRLASSAVPLKPSPPKESLEVPNFVEVVATDVDYLPDLRGGLFGGRNSIGLVFESDGVRNSATLGTGARSRSNPMKYAPAEEFAFQLVEYGTLTTYEISNLQSMKASELGQKKQLTFRIRESTFASNPNIDQKKKTVSLTVQLLPFDPEKSSVGEDQAPTFGPGQPASSTVSFVGQHATDHVKLAAGKGICVIRLPLSGQSEPSDTIFSVRQAQPKSKFEPVKQLADLRIWTAPCDAAAGTMFRIVAQPLSGGGTYHIALVQDTARAADFANLTEVMLSDFVTAPSSGGSQPDEFVRSVGNLRRHLGVDDAPRILNQFERLLAKDSGSYSQGQLSRLVAALLESESTFYRAAEDSPVLRVHLALFRGENGKPYDRAVLLTALQSSDPIVAERAVRIVGKIKDPNFVKATLSPFLLDRRDSVMQAARGAILGLDRPPSPNSP
jgi:uncharacterized caspase-like protein